jgi:hypothetical protein
MADRLGDAGARPQKEPTYAPIFVAASLTGLYTQRNVFHDPSNVVTQRFYGGRPDTLFNGLNVELSNNLTLIRRFGTVAATTSYTEAPHAMFQWELDDGTLIGMVDTAGALYQEPFNGASPTLILTKTGSGQGYFVASGNTLYYGDGVDLIKYTPGNPNGIVWNWGIAAPMSPPAVTVVASGSSAVNWAANTVFSTMGLLVDPNGNVQQLFSVNANPSSPTTGQIGESGNGAPNFNTAYLGTTSDGTVTWTSMGPVSLWAPGTTFQPGNPIYDPGTNCIFLAHTPGFTTGTKRPIFTSTLGFTGARVDEFSGGGRWENIGQVGVQPTAVLGSWLKNTHFNQFGLFSSGSPVVNPSSAIAFPLIPSVNSFGQLNNGQPTFIIGASVAGTTSNTSFTPWTGISSQSIGQITLDNQLAWICQGPAAWAATQAEIAWSNGNATFSVKKDINGNMQVCIASGTTGATAPTWGTVYGAQTTDGTVKWTCVGPPVTWTANTNWFLPAPGFSPPLASQQYGGAEVIGTGFVQAVTTSGLSGSTAPTWSVVVGNTTTDNAITWTTVAPQSAQSITWQKSHVYAYSWKCRTPTDDYVTTSLLTFANLNLLPALTSLGNVPGLVSPLGPYLGGGTGAVSTASPVFTIATPNTTGAVNTVSGLGSTDPQVDTIIIWRDADGGGADNMFELIEIPSPPPIAGVAQPWTFKDFLPDIPTTTNGINFPGLDNLSPAPIDESNNPPPAGFLPLCDDLHFSRVWGAVGNTVFFSGGPDVLVGNPNEAFNPEDDFPFKSTVVALIHSPAGLIAPTSTDWEVIYGGPSTSSFFSDNMIKGIGLLNYNSWDRVGGEIYFMSPDKQMWALNPSLQLARGGFPIGDQFLSRPFNESGFFSLTAHENGTDNAIYEIGRAHV